MFAENIIQAGLEQVKTTRGDSLNEIHSSYFFHFLSMNFSEYKNISVNDTIVQKVTFTTRYVAGANFLGLLISLSAER